MIELVDIAEAVKDELETARAANTFGSNFVLSRTWLPVFELKDLKNLYVTVAPVSDREDIDSRADFREELRVDVGIMKALPANWGNDHIDPLVLFSRTVAKFFRKLRLGVEDKFYYEGTLHAPIVAREHLEQYGQFTSLIQLTFAVIGD